MAEPKPADWAVLGVARDASKGEARAAYLARAMALHPDLHPDATIAERERLDAAMAALNDAWDRVEAWHAREPEPTRGPTRRRRGAAEPTVRVVRAVPQGFVAVSVADPYAVGDQLELRGVSADLLGLAAIAGEPVRLLRCTNRPLDDDHVAAIAHLPELHSLDLDGTGVTDRALSVLARLPRLSDLHLSDTRVTDAGLGAVGRVPLLHSLSLAGTRVSDLGLAALEGHPRLAVLNLRGTGVEGPGLLHLAGCPALRMLALPRVDREDRRAFADRRPDVTFA